MPRVPASLPATHSASPGVCHYPEFPSPRPGVPPAAYFSFHGTQLAQPHVWLCGFSPGAHLVNLSIFFAGFLGSSVLQVGARTPHLPMATLKGPQRRGRTAFVLTGAHGGSRVLSSGPPLLCSTDARARRVTGLCSAAPRQGPGSHHRDLAHLPTHKLCKDEIVVAKMRSKCSRMFCTSCIPVYVVFILNEAEAVRVLF